MQKKSFLQPAGFLHAKVCTHYRLPLSTLFLLFSGFFLSLSVVFQYANSTHKSAYCNMCSGGIETERKDHVELCIFLVDRNYTEKNKAGGKETAQGRVERDVTSSRRGRNAVSIQEDFTW